MNSELRTFGEADRPEIEYPCRWSYKVVGESEERLRAVIRKVVGDTDHTLKLSNTSRTGKYVSLALDVLVRDEVQRRGIGQTLHEHIDVRLVL